MTTSPERAGAAPWYCSHESSRAATSTMVAAGLVATAALMAFVGLLVAGDEVSALVAAMVMLVAGANTWSAGRSRSWWRADTTPDRGSRPRPTVAPPRARTHPYVAAPGLADQGHVRQPPRPGEVRGVPVAGAPRLGPARVEVVVLSRAQQPTRSAVPDPNPDPDPDPDILERPACADPGSASSVDGPDERTTSSRTGRTAPASATRRRTAPVRPVSRRVAGTRSS